MSTPFTEMTVEDIYQWLQTKGFEVDIADALRDAEMDGDAMIGAYEARLDSLSSIVPSLGKRLKLSRLLKKEMEGVSNSADTSCIIMAPASSAPKELQKKNPARNEHDSEEGYLSSSSDSVEMQVAHADLEPDSEPEPSSDTDEETKVVVKPPIKRPKVECATGAVALVKRISAKKEQPPLPKPFPIRTNFTRDIAKCLEEECLTGKARSKFITAIASSIFQVKSYPTRDEYNHVCEQLIRKWPFLRSRTGHGYITEALKERMKYLRGTSGRKRDLQGAEAPVESKPKQKKSQHQYPDSPVPPPVPHGEDRPSHDRHVRMLAAEYRKLHPNPKITKDIMRRTFPFRRADIKDKVIPLSDLLKRYPPLREYTELRMELDRILEKNVGDAAVETWLQLCDKIIVLADQEADNPTIKRLRQLAPADSLSEDAKSLHALSALLLDARYKDQARP